ncbi:MAG: hypothetical protein Q8L23_03490 [Caulobacter sp.]|nr:hypothetical protein [Caulobacter sp.]
MTAEQRLAAFLREGQAPQRDPAFAVQVMRRVARRELAARLGISAVLAATAAAALWAVAPALSAVIEPLARTLAPAAVLLTLTAAFVMVTQGLAEGRVPD